MAGIYSKEQIIEFRTKIRRLMAVYPKITSRRVAKELELSQPFVLKQMRKIRVENIKRIERTIVEEDLAGISEFIDAVLPKIAAIISRRGSKDSDKINALKAVVAAKDIMIKRKMDAGIFERHLGELEVKGKLDVEERKLLKRAFGLYVGGDNEDNGGPGEAEGGNGE